MPTYLVLAPPSPGTRASWAPPSRVWLGPRFGTKRPHRTAILCASPPGGRSENLATKIALHYSEVQSLRRPYSAAVKDFTDSAILAYECGFSEQQVQEELQALATEEDASKILFPQHFDPKGCLELLAVVWTTLMVSPRTVQRWSSGAALQEETLQKWSGFVRLLVNAYFEKRMAWYSVDRASLELKMAGRAEPADVVAERMRLVYTTLETVYPQFPSI